MESSSQTDFRDEQLIKDLQRRCDDLRDECGEQAEQLYQAKLLTEELLRKVQAQTVAQK